MRPDEFRDLLADRLSELLQQIGNLGVDLIGLGDDQALQLSAQAGNLARATRLFPSVGSDHGGNDLDQLLFGNPQTIGRVDARVQLLRGQPPST